jgi:hypothetical protein
MKKLLIFLSASLLVFVASCSEETIEPQPLTEDLKTSANGYWDQFLSIHVTTHWDDDIIFFLMGTGGNITVDWGDGTRESIYVGEEYVGLDHDFNREEEDTTDFAIRISGDLKAITTFNYYYDGLVVNEMHFGGLTNLKELDMGVLQDGPPVINLSKNKLIERVLLPGVQRLQDLILPTSNKIQAIDISGTNELSTADADRIIARVHDSVVKSPRTGYFNLPASWAQEEDDPTMIGPPSSYSMNKLRKLKRKYGWNIFPYVK